MSFYEMMCFAKVYNVACGFSSPLTVSKQELDIVCEILKKNADNCWNWNQEQKEFYKLLVDYTKNHIEENRNDFTSMG